MATDNLNQLGRSLGDTQDKTEHVTRRVAENFPLVESLRDTVGILLPYQMEFFTYRENNPVYLDIFFQEPLATDAVIDISNLPLTISETGLSVGLEGQVGIENVWYPLVALRDLNFLTSASYTVVFDTVTNGTGDYYHKIVFDGGGVDLTNVTTIGVNQITVEITQANVISPPATTLYDAYIYGKVENFSAGGWLHYTVATVFDAYGLLYTPRVIG